VAVVLAGAVGFLLYKGLTSGIEYFKTVPEALAARVSLGTSTFQLEGVVAPHTLVRTGPSSQRFVLCDGGDRIPVEDQSTPPQLFEPAVAVVLVGHFIGATDRFASDQILVKHSNAYVAAHPGRIRAGDGQRC
jgi:cytochrome c-type biogenesis protein CcmE